VSRKALQLCGQVRDALRTILSGLADEVLQNLTVVSVEPAPHSGRLLVTVAAPDPADVTDRAVRTERLNGAAGLIRLEVAGSVHRRKTRNWPSGWCDGMVCRKGTEDPKEAQGKDRRLVF
jgi:hypothetical protein